MEVWKVITSPKLTLIDYDKAEYLNPRDFYNITTKTASKELNINLYS